jgi:small-conductance mechanosensitive channel
VESVSTGLTATLAEAWYYPVLYWATTYGLRILATLAVGAIAWVISYRAIDRVTEAAVKRAMTDRPAANRNTDSTTELTDAIMGQRREQRARALGQLLRSISAFIIGGITLLVVLTQLGMDIAPLLASAGVIGVALGFGAQTLVKDFLSGIFLVLEDQYGPGDVVDLGSAIGTVEEVGLRITRLRDASGVVWYVRNGEILRVGNRSQGWTLAIVDVPIAYDEDLDRVRRLVEKIGRQMDADSSYDAVLLGTPTYAGVESVSGDAMFIRVTARSAPDQRLVAERAIREQLKLAFDQTGIRMPILARPATGLPPGNQPNPPNQPRQ